MRGRDKLNHFMRWAIAATADLPIEDRLPNLQAMLPDGLVGRHAMSHLQHAPDLRPAQEHLHLERRRRGWAARERARRQVQQTVELDLIRDLLRLW